MDVVIPLALAGFPVALGYSTAGHALWVACCIAIALVAIDLYSRCRRQSLLPAARGEALTRIMWDRGIRRLPGESDRAARRRLAEIRRNENRKVR